MRARPPNAGKGRKAGVPNKLSADLKAMILSALDEAGGVTYLVAQAEKNPAAFMALLGKVLPMPLEHSGESVVTRTCYLTEAEAAALASGERAGNV